MANVTMYIDCFLRHTKPWFSHEHKRIKCKEVTYTYTPYEKPGVLNLQSPHFSVGDKIHLFSCPEGWE